MNKIFLYSFLNFLSLLPGFVFVFGGKYYLEDYEFINFVKEKTIIILLISIFSMGLSQATTYLRSSKFNIKNIIFHIQMFHLVSTIFIFAFLIFLKGNVLWFAFLENFSALAISLIIFLFLSNSEMLNIFRLTNKHNLYLQMISLRVILSLLVYYLTNHYIITLLISESILFILFYKNDFLKNFYEFSLNKLLLIIKKGIPFFFVISLSPLLLFIMKYYLDFITTKKISLIGDFELLFSFYSIITFLIIGPFRIIFFPIMVRLEKRNKNRSYKNENIMFFLIIVMYMIALLLEIYVPDILKFIDLKIYLINFSEVNKLIILFVILNSSNLFWLSKLYEKGELKKMALPYVISVIVCVILGFYGLKINSFFTIILSGSMGVFIFYLFGTLNENKVNIFKRLVLLFILGITSFIY